MITKEQVLSSSGSELDEMVALAQGWCKGNSVTDGIVWFDGREWHENYHPSTNGSQCMEIMEREKMSTRYGLDGNAYAMIRIMDGNYAKESFHGHGKDMKEAAMRCFVFSKLEVINGN